MNITELLKDDTVILDLVSQSKDQVIDELVTKLDEAGRLDDKGLHVDEKEKAVLQAENDGESVRKHVEGTDLILAVTACPTGIAHTYMAADALKTKAEEMKIDFNNGATGVKHRLTEDDIAQATAIIVVADKQVDMARFNGKPIIQVPVAQGI